MSFGLASFGVRIMLFVLFLGLMLFMIVDVGEIDFDLLVFCGVFGDVCLFLGGYEFVFKALDELKRENSFLVGEVEMGEIVFLIEFIML